jgi:steroid 5-alpha reductase family enzyme
MNKTEKIKALVIVALVYIIAGLAAIVTLEYLPISIILRKTMVADIVATLVVFIFSMLYKNSSMYDPYWSVAPIFIAFYWLYEAYGFPFAGADFTIWIMILLLITWGVRLTWNWMLRWEGFNDEDWRYVKIKKKTGVFYWPSSFISIHLMPTLWVFAGMVPVYYAINANTTPVSILMSLATLVTIVAISLETIADNQLRKHLRTRKSKNELLKTGLWGIMSFPNYMGEILFWWGMYLFALAYNVDLWWTIFGPLSITLLFVFISIPMMKKRRENKVAV